MPSSTFAGLVVGVAVVSIGLYHFGFVAPRLRRLDAALRVDDVALAGDATSSLALLRAAHTALAQRTDERLERLEGSLVRDLLRIGFVRYNSFSDVGSDQSFTLALLSAEGNGVVVSSIFGREETRTYGKAVRAFTAQQDASKEEQSAIAMARNGDVALVRT